MAALGRISRSVALDASAPRTIQRL